MRSRPNRAPAADRRSIRSAQILRCTPPVGRLRFRSIRDVEEEAKLPGSRRLFSAVLGYLYAVAGRKAEAHALLEELKARLGSEFEIALIHIGLGDIDQAFEWLEKAYNKRDQYLLYLRVDPNMDTLRSDPRFANLLRRVGLSQ